MSEKLQINSENISVIPMGANFDAFNPEHRDEQWVKTYNLNRPVFLFVGRIAEKKGLKYLLEAFAHESIKQTQATLAIVGDGPLRIELESYCQQLKLTEKVQFLGTATHDELKIIYASADVFCVPSIVAEDGDAEGLPTVLSEAAASGLPSIGTRTGGIPEIIIDNETGLLIEQKNAEAIAKACLRYINDPELLKLHGITARKRTAKFSWEKIGERFEQKLEQLWSHSK